MPRGRPREFDVDKALDRALKVFWRKGYEGASLPDLTKAMGINRPSLYAAFGNKEALFRKAIERYVEGPAATSARRSKNRPPAPSPSGCCGGADRPDDRSAESARVSHGAGGAGLRRGGGIRPPGTGRSRAAGEAAVRKRFERAVAEGDLPADADPADLARYVVTLMRGMAVQAAGGASREELRRVAELALRQLGRTDKTPLPDRSPAREPGQARKERQAVSRRFFCEPAADDQHLKGCEVGWAAGPTGRRRYRTPEMGVRFPPRSTDNRTYRPTGGRQFGILAIRVRLPVGPLNGSDLLTAG